MSLQRVACAACGVLGLAFGAAAQEKVKLDYKLQPGMELIYKISGTTRMSAPGQGEEQATLSGHERFVVADLDAATGVMRIGQLPEIKLTMKKQGPQGARNEEQSLNDVSVCRMDRSGNPLVRKLKDEEKFRPYAMKMLLRMLDHRELDSVALPAEAIAVGDAWANVTDAALGAMPQTLSTSKVVSTLAEIKTVDGRKCALIKSKLSPGDEKIGGGAPDFAVSGDVETLFDMEGGFSRSVSSKLDIKINAGDQTIAGTVEMTAVLDSKKTLAPEELAREAKVIAALDAAVANLYEGEYATAAAPLEGLKPAELPDTWKVGINKATHKVKAIAQGPQGRPAMPPQDPAMRLLAEAEKAQGEGKWAEALQDCNKVIALKPDSVEAYNQRAVTYFHMRKYDLALRDCDNAIRLKPDYAEAYYNRGNVCAAAGRFDEALRDCGKAIALRPDYREAYTSRARTYYDTKEYGKAWADVKMSEKLGGRPAPEFLKALTEAAARPEN